MTTAKSKSPKSAARPADPKTRVLVLYTGGTIGMVPSGESENSPLRPGNADELSKRVRAPDEEIWWDIVPLEDERGDVVGPLDLSSVGPRHWQLMASAIQKNYDQYDGFVILHGTDTMAFTASALSFLLHNLAKPVILTGSQLPIFHDRTDAVMNFTNALYIAGYKAKGLPRLSEVAICFGDALLRGSRTTKVSTSRWQGFDTPNYPHLGTLGEHIVIDESVIRQPDSQEFFAYTELEPRVATVTIYPGMGADVLRSFLSMEAIKGFSLRCFGAGNAPEEAEFLEVLRKAIQVDGKLIVNTTQCLEGTVEMGRYAASSGLQSAGVLTGLDLTPEAALTKMMWLLASGEAPTQMQIDQRGEQTGSVFELRYDAPAGAVREFKKSVNPPGRYRTQALRFATLRAEGIEFEGNDRLGRHIGFHVFVNFPPARRELANDKTPQYAGKLSGIYNGPKDTVLVLDIAKTISRVHETGRELMLAILSEDGEAFSAKGFFLTLSTD